ncbi:Eco57I restriction-modification methylase domain-containing protein [Halanaerobacter jeridensis]|uniref:site-specific DNA-methyltransferase (adenine-specific) n=1 Tax=Halanaerobacter jeridensis TaxID=706427 RepID=A0A938XTU7_9FIRM|nr:TaqI-like C-terminal specificity domain-containing protein [Halanaerobacter jeridensis]MBM7557410.1 adenine-specific DNA-methyltransferase [Halanaerobacter jeridensis]
MRKELLKSTFSTKFDLDNLEELIAEIYESPIAREEIDFAEQNVNSFLRLKAEDEQNVVLVLETTTELKWNFKLRKLVADYLAEHQLKQGLVAFFNPQQQDWYWTIVHRTELSPYLLNCYSIPVGPNMSGANWDELQQSLKNKDLQELTRDFGTALRKKFVADCKEYHQLLEDKLTLSLGAGLKEELSSNLAELAEKLLSKLILFYILTKKELLEVKFRDHLETSEQKKLVDLAQLEILDLFIKDQNKIILPQKIELVKEVWELLNDYDLSITEDEPWAKVLTIGPEILADVHEELLGANQRKTNGVFYTPKQVVHYMSQQSIIEHLLSQIPELDYQQVKNLVRERELANIDKSLLPQIYKSLSEIKVCDPAVGSGAFALGIAKELFRIKEIVIYLIGDQVMSQELKVNTVKDSLYCLDIDRGAVEITKLRLWLWTAAEKKFLGDLKYQIIESNPLLKIERNLEQQDTELKAARNDYYQQSTLRERKKYKQRYEQLKEEKLGKVFSLVDYFPKVFKQGGFNIVISNPPYVGEKGNKEIFREIKKYSLGQFYSGKMDLFYFFFHLGLDIVCEQGTVALITTNYYLTATGGYQLREDLQQRGVIKKLINFNNLRLFPAAIGQHNLITILQKDSSNQASAVAENIVTYREGDADEETLLQILAETDEQSNYYTVPQEKLYQGPEKYLRLEVDKIDDFLTVVAEKSEELGTLCNVNQGIVSGCDRVSNRHIKGYDLPQQVKGSGIFVLTAAEVEELNLSQDKQEVLKPWFKNSDIKQYWCQQENKGEYILYLKQGTSKLTTALKDHLRPFRAILESRREVAADRIKWWELQWPRSKEIFEEPKLVVPQRSKINTFAYTEDSWYASADVYYITQPQPGVKLKYILALLNSTLYYLWFYYKGKKKGNLLELYQKPLTEVPIKVISLEQQQIFIDLVEQIELKKEKLIEYQAITFAEIKNKVNLTTRSTLKEIIDDSKVFEVDYHGQAKIVRDIKVVLKEEKVELYSAKSSTGYYRLFEFEVLNNQLRKYLKFYLESLTTEQLEEINNNSNSALVDRVLEIEIPGYQEVSRVQTIVDYWEEIQESKSKIQEKIIDLQEEIDQLVYQLYDFNAAEIEFLTKKKKEIKNY